MKTSCQILEALHRKNTPTPLSYAMKAVQTCNSNDHDVEQPPKQRDRTGLVKPSR
jgi:hypothetical protein